LVDVVDPDGVDGGVGLDAAEGGCQGEEGGGSHGDDGVLVEYGSSLKVDIRSE